MYNLLFEVYSEEIPSEMQHTSSFKIYSDIEKKMSALFNKKLDGNYFYTPNRIGFFILNVPSHAESVSKDIKGPKITADDKAIQGFMRKNSIKNINDMKKLGDYFFYQKTMSSKSPKEEIKSIIEDVLLSFNWPRSMRWGEYPTRWIRPIHYITCLLNEEIIPVKFGHIVAGNQTKFRDRLINVKSFESYRELSKKENVLIFQEERLKVMLSEVREKCQKHNIFLVEDYSLLKEIANLVEYPYVAIGRIEKEFLDMPREFLVSMLKFHQKYLMTEDENGDLAPFFIIVSNVMTKDNLNTVILGNEKVLKSRLYDARYFYNQDLNYKLIERLEKLKKVTYHHKIGSYYKIVTDIKNTALNIAEQISFQDKYKVCRASLLLKSDLVTEIVSELPDLQGIAGYYYALKDNESPDIASSIREHYLPQGPNDKVPTSNLGIIMSLADKIIKLNSMFSINIKPTGSKDPYALRRAAIGIIRIICSNKIQINLKHLISQEVENFIKERVEVLSKDKKNIYDIDLKYINESI